MLSSFNIIALPRASHVYFHAGCHSRDAPTDRLLQNALPTRTAPTLPSPLAARVESARHLKLVVSTYSH